MCPLGGTIAKQEVRSAVGNVFFSQSAYLHRRIVQIKNLGHRFETPYSIMLYHHKVALKFICHQFLWSQMSSDEFVLYATLWNF